MRTVKEVDDWYLFRLLSGILAHYEKHKEYPKTWYLRQDEYDWARQTFNVLDHITLGHVTIKIHPNGEEI